MKFALLASGSKGNCCVIKDEGCELIIDCGTTKRYLNSCFERLSYQYESADALLITHTHKDHVSQLKMFDALPVFACAKLERKDANYVKAYERLKIRDFDVTILPMSHDCDGTIGFVIEGYFGKMVYITDTGYIRKDVMPYIENADYYVFESNHNIEMLMQTARPVFVKQRIINDMGHLCNEDSAYVLSQVIGDKTKEIVLAHISQEGNHRQLAADTLIHQLQRKDLPCNKLSIYAAEQFGIYIGGNKEQ